MCDVGLAIQGIGAIGSAAGAYYSGRSKQIALQSEAYMADPNARLADDEGRLYRQQGEQAQVAAKLRTGQIKSQQRVALASGGVALDEGSALNQLVSTEVMGEIDALTIDANAIRAQGAKSIEAVNYRNKANTARTTAKAMSPFADAAVSLLGNASSALTRYGDFGSFSGGKGGARGFSDSFNQARRTSIFDPAADIEAFRANYRPFSF